METMSFNVEELKKKRMLDMTGEEILALLEHRSQERRESENQQQGRKDKNLVYGYKGVAKLLGCSIATASRIILSGRIDKAISKIGRTIVVDSEVALEQLSITRTRGGRSATPRLTL